MSREFNLLPWLIFLAISLSSCSSKNSSLESILEKEHTEESDTVAFLQDEYTENVSTFEKIIPSELEKKLSEHDYTLSYYIYFGEKKCPHCEEFVSRLSKQAKEKDIKIHYIDTENNKSIILDEIKNNYEINTIPQLLKIYNSKKEFRLINTDSDIIAF